ncbi:MAG: hypothetical protein HY275_11620 [Gemmatimonadetes bacterium]|nr:hypothetical protein [Gemmatimonadota bacterium]
MTRARNGSATRRKVADTPLAPMLVWVLVPFIETDDPTIQYYNDFEAGREEFARAFAALRLEFRWQQVTMRDFARVIDGIPAASAGYRPVIFNLCDGDETNGSPGISVIRHLEHAGLPYTGANEHFFDITTSKIPMKEAFDKAGVPTAPWEVIPPTTRQINGVFKRIPAPLILKPAISAGSMGLGCKNVVSSRAELIERVSELRNNEQGWSLAEGGLFVERFIAGREFTTFIIGNGQSSDSAIVFPPVERVFNPELPPTEQFLSFDRLWEFHKDEAPLPGGANLWEYAPVPSDLSARVCDVSWAAYAAVGGTGYGRVDLRMDAETGELYVLEVNAQCGLSEDENYTSIGAILRFASTPYSAIVKDILEECLRRPVAAPTMRS